MPIKFYSEAYFFRLEIFLTSLKSQTQDPRLKTLQEDLCSGFTRPEKIHRPQPDVNPRTSDLEASTLPRDHRDRLLFTLF